jgi:hypothetical protein
MQAASAAGMDGEARARLAQRLAAQGWDQGCRLPFTRRLFLTDGEAPVARLAAQGLVAADKLGETGPQVLLTGPDQQVGSILVTQVCDLLADPAVEPCAEAMPIVVLGDGQVLPQPNSTRTFVLDEPKRWVVDATHRLQIEKSLIPSAAAQQLLDSPERRRLFAAWIARRAARAAFPNDFDATVSHVIKTQMTRRRFAEDPIVPHLHLLRVGLPRDGQPKVFLALPFDERRVSQEAADAYAAALEAAIRNQLPDRVRRARAFSAERGGQEIRDFEVVALQAVPLDRMTLRTMLDMPPLNLEYVTYRRGAIAGAEPHVEGEG